MSTFSLFQDPLQQQQQRTSRAVNESRMIEVDKDDMRGLFLWLRVGLIPRKGWWERDFWERRAGGGEWARVSLDMHSGVWESYEGWEARLNDGTIR